MEKELSANTVTFISCRCRLTKVLAGAAREEIGSKGGEGRVRLLDVDAIPRYQRPIASLRLASMDECFELCHTKLNY